MMGGEAEGSARARALVVFLALTFVLGAVQFGRLAYRLLAGPSGSLPGQAPAAVQPTAWPQASPAVPAAANAQPGAAPRPCTDGIEDGSFEAGTSWRLVNTAYSAAYVSKPAAYVSDPVRSGRRALRLGIADGPDTFSHSCAEQTVTIPAQVAAARLSFWILPQTAGKPGDAQYLLVLREGGGYDTLLWELTNASDWQRREVSLDAYRGQRVVLQFGVLNDGDGARTAMYVDDVTLDLCTAAPPAP